ncbi:hypothetical protein SD80_032000 [Scytonema tolypothrichoides VB-61278]|nr:hypothetical protein SD80_032000 [Scytonema tolypothrichoides VB-61278]
MVRQSAEQGVSTPGATLREAASGVYKSGKPPNALAPGTAVHGSRGYRSQCGLGVSRHSLPYGKPLRVYKSGNPQGRGGSPSGAPGVDWRISFGDAKRQRRTLRVSPSRVRLRLRFSPRLRAQSAYPDSRKAWRQP